MTMKWFEAYDIISSGGMVKREGWEMGTYIMLTEDLDNDEESCLINEKDEFVTVEMTDLQADDWIEYDPHYRPFEEYTDKEFHTYVKETCRAKMEYQGKLLASRLRFMAERNDCLPVWEMDKGLKYFIVFSNHQYRIESTYKEYYPNTVYFTNKEVCQVALNTYRYSFDLVRKLDWQYNLLLVMDYTREELNQIHRMLETV